ncbi:hypothetical protein Tco_1505150 [Tanacetum coccineum]
MGCFGLCDFARGEVIGAMGCGKWVWVSYHAAIIWESWNAQVQDRRCWYKRNVVGSSGFGLQMVDSKSLVQSVTSSWGRFKTYLKIADKEMSVEDLVVVEHAGSSSRFNFQGNKKDKGTIVKKGKGKLSILLLKLGL